MAKSLIIGVALIVSALILASGGLQAERVMLPPEEPAPPPADSDSVPVAITNFPTVDIRGFPHVVTVEGTVDVGNLPATQPVSGTVDVGNLPLDADGNLKVSPSADSSPAYRFFRLPDLYASADGTVEWSAPFDVSGWGSIDFVVKLENRTSSFFLMPTQVAFIDPDAGPIFAEDSALDLRGDGPFLFPHEVHGPEMRVGIRGPLGGTATAQVWVYLSN